MTRASILVVGCLWGATPAYATATVNCSISDGPLVVAFEGSVSHGMGGVMTSVRGTVTPPPKLLTSGTITLEHAHLTQYWLSGPVLKVRLYLEPAAVAGASIDVVIEATQSRRDPTAFEGRYRAEVAVPAEGGASEGRTEQFKGRADCSAS